MPAWPAEVLFTEVERRLGDAMRRNSVGLLPAVHRPAGSPAGRMPEPKPGRPRPDTRPYGKAGSAGPPATLVMDRLEQEDDSGRGPLFL